MAVWEVWRQDDGGNRYRVAVYDDRIEALARVLEFDSGPVHKQMYWVSGQPGPQCASADDLCARLTETALAMSDAGRTLDEFLRAWWQVSAPLAMTPKLDGDTVAAMIAVAAVITPPPLHPVWRTRMYVANAPETYADWERIIVSQIADLADFADAGGLGAQSYFGADAPRPADCTRATSRRWFNFDPQAYLTCGLQGSLARGVSAADGFSWGDLARLAICGQIYE